MVIGFINFQSDNGVSAILVPLNALKKGAATFSIIAQPIDATKISSYCIQAFDMVGHTSQQYCFTTAALGVASEASPPLSLSVFPDPISGIATMILEGAESANIEIFDILGREIDRFQISGSYDWQTGGLPSGTYIIHASNGREILSKRIIKQ